MKIDETYPGFDDESPDRDEKLKYTLGDDEPGETTDKDDLKYNPEDDSFEYDVESEDPDYDHPDPYNTSVKNGDDINSTYDESNPYAVDEYIPNESLETDVDKLGMHIDSGKIVEVDPVDEAISRTPEDDRDDLDEEGYPKNDRENFK
ncbi:hypothetical protein GCM10023149_35670 [Mucilaginibacter gynuensis]|uniref:Uncharacterized protein n=1 Tax=Mucilaginibacter gynuensis TaxID=1302236 RepID=A0ABP8GVQ2_9SPHI